MKVQSKTGRVLHLENNEVTAALLDAGIVKPSKEPDPLPPSVIDWRVGRSGVSGRPAIVGTCPRCRLSVNYDGRPSNVGKQVINHCGILTEIPADIAAEYERLYNFDYRLAPAKPAPPPSSGVETVKS